MISVRGTIVSHVKTGKMTPPEQVVRQAVNTEVINYIGNLLISRVHNFVDSKVQLLPELCRCKTQCGVGL